MPDPALVKALGDEDRQVRWEAVLASQKCGVPPMLMPRGLCHAAAPTGKAR